MIRQTRKLHIAGCKKLQYAFNDEVDQHAMHSWLQDAGIDFCCGILKLVQCYTKHGFHSDDFVEK
jgi:hypothetical protein